VVYSTLVVRSEKADSSPSSDTGYAVILAGGMGQDIQLRWAGYDLRREADALCVYP